MVAAAAVLYLSSAADQLGDLDGDAAHYVLLAERIAQHLDYRDPVVPGAPAHVRYPPLYPVLLAPLVALLGRDMLAIRAFVALLSALALAPWLLVYRRLVPPPAALGLAALLAVHPYHVNFASRTLSETPFLLLSGIALWLYLRWRDDDRPRDLWLCALALALCFLTRSAAIALMAALAATMALDPALRKRQLGPVPAWLATGAIMAAVFAAWTVYVKAFSGPAADYFAELGGKTAWDGKNFHAGIIVNAGYYAIEIPVKLLAIEPLARAGRWSAPAVALAALAWPVLAFGMIRLSRSGRAAAPRYFAFTAAMILVWPPYLDFRFFYPALPLLLLFGYSAMEWTSERAGAFGRASALAAFSVFGLIFVYNTVALVGAWRSEKPYPPYLPMEVMGRVIRAPVIDWSDTAYARTDPERNIGVGEFVLLNEMLASQTPPDAVVMSQEPRDTTPWRSHL